MTKHHQKPASFLERLIFNNRPAVVVLCLLISAFLFYQRPRFGRRPASRR